MADANNVAVYDSSCVRSAPETEGELAVGTRWRGATKVLGREFDWVTECTELEPEKSATFKSVEGKLPFEIRTQYSPDGEGTRLVYRIDAESGLGGVFGRLADPARGQGPDPDRQGQPGHPQGAAGEPTSELRLLSSTAT